MVSQLEPDRERFRALAIAKAGGTSSSIIKDCIRAELSRRGPFESIADVGAGKGELLASLDLPGVKLLGVDFLARPSGLDPDVDWISADLNGEVDAPWRVQCVVCSETIEHLENPRKTMRLLHRLLQPGGTLILTMPNQESVRSYSCLIAGGHFAAFLGEAYPAHITALLRMDLRRMCEEVGFEAPTFGYTNEGGIPKAPHVTGQSVSAGLLRGRLFSDNLIMTTRRR
jgi:2-polyprenyl-3-methyl-5-hydroxy-6-metoxy-1,4-benzoquinol methylase